MSRTLLHAQDIADYFLAKVDEESGDVMTHLKLQKLLYYAQGLYLAHQGEPLFAEADRGVGSRGRSSPRFIRPTSDSAAR